ncbi:MAG: transposase [Rhodobacteraceae bacterium]|nr:MAG: transposase [Paracoccaceae bacterium]
MRSFVSFARHRVITFGLASKLGRFRSGCASGIKDAGLPVVCIEARHAKAAMVAMNRNKNDRNDARSLAHLVRSGWFKAVHVKSLRTLLTAREFYVNKLRDHENEIRGLLHRALLRLTENDELCRRFMTIPGVGPVTALAFKATIDDPARFRRSNDVGAHLGLTPRQYQSGETDVRGRISRSGDAFTRGALFAVAHVMLTRSRQWTAIRAWGLRIAQRSNLKKAKIAVARKLAVIMHRMWRDETPFRWGTKA